MILKKLNLPIFKKIIVLSLFLSAVFSLQSCQSSSTTSSHNESAQDPKNYQISIDKTTNTIKTTTQPEPQQKNYRRPLFDWPVNEARMTRGWLPKGTRRSRRPHKGIDLAAPRGSAVLTSHDGLVIYTGKDFRGFGKMIMIEKEGWATLYAHLDKIVVFEGQSVKQGEVIGALGNTGRSSGPHLHFEIRKVSGPVDPLPHLPAGEGLTNDVDDGSEEY